MYIRNNYRGFSVRKAVSASLVCLAALLWAAGSVLAQGQLPCKAPITAPMREKCSAALLDAFARGEQPDILIAFGEQADLSAASTMKGKEYKAQFVFERLKAQAERSQANARQLLKSAGAKANSFYIVNAIAVDQADCALVARLAELPETAQFSLDPWVYFPRPATQRPVARDRSGLEWGVQKIRAPEVWYMGYKGAGVTVGGGDTGYDWQHPAIKSKYRGGNDHNYNWHDAVHGASPLNSNADNPCGFNTTAPCDDESHGTHTMGTMVGDDEAGNQIGVAPEARWIGCRNMERGWGRPSGYIECFEWFLAPTDTAGKNPNPALAPHAINNSWYCSKEEGCVDLSVSDLLRQAIAHLKASGVVVVVSAGNEGKFGCSSVAHPPAYFEESFSVGATRLDDTLTHFSSLGPVMVDGSMRVKPNVCAPGDAVRSCVPNGGYDWKSGTSMAGPHVVGLVALLISAQPALAGEPDLIENIIEQSARPIYSPAYCSEGPGLIRPNNYYGYGRVDALEAVRMALLLSDTEPAARAPEVGLIPNPVVGRAALNIKNARAGMATFKVWSADGRLVYSMPVFVQEGATTHILETGSWEAGIYFWQLQSETRNVAGKLVKTQ